MKILKQLICLTLALAMLAAAGCGGGNTEETGSETADGKETEEIMYNENAAVRSLTVGGVDISKFTVVYKRSADSAFNHAMDDLVSYIEKATGVTLQTVKEGEKSEHEICLGATDRDTERVKEERAKLTNNGYLIIYDGGRLYISGKDATGTMYGVYSFLEDFIGCRFYTPSYEIIKSAERIDIPSDTCVTFSPKFVYRDSYWYCAFDPAFSAKQKINSPMSRNMTGYGETYTLANGLAHTIASLSVTDFSKQPCLTDEKTYKTVLATVRALLKANPKANVISVSQNDNQNYCTCENCKKLDDAAGSPMGSLLTFVNRIANAIKDEYPNVYIETLAYQYTIQPPRTVKPADNVIICICPIESCYAHSLGADCNKKLGVYMKQWAKICKNIFVWDYTTDFRYYLNPFPNFGSLWENARFYVNNSVTGVFSQGNYSCESGEFGELRAYLIAKLLWDPEMSRERYYEYMDDFLEGYYGAGWKYIREYIDIISETADKNHLYIWSDVNDILGLAGKKKSEKEEFISTLKALWDKALEAADEEHYKHVEKSSIQILHAELFTKNADSEKKKALHKLLKKYHITNLSEGKIFPVKPDFSKSYASWYN